MTTISLDFSVEEFNAIKVLAKVNHTSPEQVIIDTCREAFKGLFENPIEYILNHIEDQPATMAVPEPELEIPIAKPYSERKPAKSANNTYTEPFFEKNLSKIRNWLSGKGATLDEVLNKLIVDVGKTQDKDQYRASKHNLRYWLLKMSEKYPIVHESGSQDWVWKAEEQTSNHLNVPFQGLTLENREPRVEQDPPKETQVPTITENIIGIYKKQKEEKPALPKMSPLAFIADTDCRAKFRDELDALTHDEKIDLDKIVGMFPEYQPKSVRSALEKALSSLETQRIVKHNSVKDEWKLTSRGTFWKKR